MNTERASLTEKVAIAAQLDATGISMQLKNKRGKSTDKTSKCKTVQVNFSIAKNVTAANGTKTSTCASLHQRAACSAEAAHSTIRTAISRLR